MKTFSIIFLPLVLIFPLHAQHQSSTSKKADAYYENMGFNKAVSLYEEGEQDLEAMERIARGYRLNHDSENAEKWYAQIVGKANDPAHYLHYAQALQSNGKTEEARQYFLLYETLRHADGGHRDRDHDAAIEHSTDPVNQTGVTITRPEAINSGDLDFSPAYYQNGIVFVSNRSSAGHAENRTDDGYNSLFYAPFTTDRQPDKARDFSRELNSRYHEGPLTFTSDYNEIYYTANELERRADNNRKGADNTRRLRIYQSFWNGDHWQESTPVDLGMTGSNDAHPALSADGLELFFASDRPGGYGGMDLYYCRYARGQWSMPVNLGSAVNTAGNEVFPFIHKDGTLYFASDGPGGIGGLDICYAEMSPAHNWQKAVNLGQPFNSPEDDFGYILHENGQEGFFSSDRDGGAGKDDIYRFSLTGTHSVKGVTRGSVTVGAYDTATGHSLTDVEMTLFTKTENGIFTAYNKEYTLQLLPGPGPGSYQLKKFDRDPFSPVPPADPVYQLNDSLVNFVLHPDKEYLLQLTKDGYQEKTMKLVAGTKDKVLRSPMSARNCTYVYGTITNGQTGSPVAEATVQIFDMCRRESREVEADAAGQYRICLADPCDYVISGKKSQFTSGKTLISTAGMEGPAASGADLRRDLVLTPALEELAVEHPGANALETGIIIGLENIYYDFNDYKLRPEAREELDKVMAFMQRQPDLAIELRSHTDSRGDDDYNRLLSGKRANEAVAYLIGHGIGPDRISASGLGEDQLVNSCDDGTPCDEEDHQKNRRTEIRVFRQVKK